MAHVNRGQPPPPPPPAEPVFENPISLKGTLQRPVRTVGLPLCVSPPFPAHMEVAIARHLHDHLYEPSPPPPLSLRCSSVASTPPPVAPFTVMRLSKPKFNLGIGVPFNLPPIATLDGSGAASPSPQPVRRRPPARLLWALASSSLPTVRPPLRGRRRALGS